MKSQTKLINICQKWVPIITLLGNWPCTTSPFKSYKTMNQSQEVEQKFLALQWSSRTKTQCTPWELLPNPRANPTSASPFLSRIFFLGFSLACLCISSLSLEEAWFQPFFEKIVIRCIILHLVSLSWVIRWCHCCELPRKGHWVLSLRQWFDQRKMVATSMVVE